MHIEGEHGEEAHGPPQRRLDGRCFMSLDGRCFMSRVGGQHRLVDGAVCGAIVTSEHAILYGTAGGSCSAAGEGGLGLLVFHMQLWRSDSFGVALVFGESLIVT
jgi:hypothetical protein